MGDRPVLTKDSTPEQVRTAWIWELRHGGHAQGQQYLTRPNRDPDVAAKMQHCCLGVLCTLAAEVGLVTASGGDDPRDSVLYFATDNPDDGDTQHLPVVVQRWVGTGEDGTVHVTTGIAGGEPQVADVIDLNDSGDYTFKQIADLLEENYSGALPQ